MGEKTGFFVCLLYLQDEVAYFSFPFNVELYFKRSATSLTNPGQCVSAILLVLNSLFTIRIVKANIHRFLVFVTNAHIAYHC